MPRNLKRINSLLAVLVLGFAVLKVAPTAIAQESTEVVNRQTYTNENAPPEIRFNILLMKIKYGTSGSDRHIAYQLEQMGFDRSDVPMVAAYLGTVRGEISEEVSRNAWRIACSDITATLSGSAIRAVFSALDDLRQGIHAKYLAIASAELATMGYPDFSNMLNGLTSSFRVTYTDHRYAWGTTDNDIHLHRADMCANLKKHSPASPATIGPIAFIADR